MHALQRNMFTALALACDAVQAVPDKPQAYAEAGGALADMHNSAQCPAC